MLDSAGSFQASIPLLAHCTVPRVIRHGSVAAKTEPLKFGALPKIFGLDCIPVVTNAALCETHLLQ